jgi:ribonuclease R
LNKKRSKGPKKAKNRIRKELLKYLSQHPNKPFNLKQLRTELDITSSNDSLHLENTLGQLAASQLVEIEGAGKVRYIGPPAETKPVEAKKPVGITGVLDLARTGVGFVKSPDFDKDIFIPAKDVNNALPGDTVVVKLTSKGGDRRPEGKVLEVVKRGRDMWVCVLQIHDKFAFALPVNKKMVVDFFVPLGKLGGAKDGDLVAVRLMGYDAGRTNPVGEVRAVLGRPGDHQSEMNAIMLEHNLPPRFDAEVEAEAAKIPETIDEGEIARRRDFRQVLTITIDPWDAKDFDDALSYNELGDGRYEIGVHIADVGHYVKPNSTIDKEAQKRATSVYLVDRVIPMLPERLSNELCSLRPNEDKCCFSAVFVMDAEATVLERWFGRTLIHSQRRFTYEEAQERIVSGQGDLSTEIRSLDTLAKKLRAARFREGAIAFDREEMRFKLDENGHPVEIVIKESLDAHKLIEEFMLLANREVATQHVRMVKADWPFVYRVHDEPDEKKLDGLEKMAKRFGYDLRLVKNKQASKEVNRMLRESKDKPEHHMLSTLAIRSMAKAKYTTKNKGHYGLAFEYYTHFTSPIRRYPDVMVHRLLADYLAGKPGDSAQWLEEQCAHSSAMEVEAEEAERDSTRYKMVEYMQQFVGDEFEGIVSGVTDHTLFVELSNKCEGGVRLGSLLDDHYQFDEENYRIIGRGTQKSYSLGQPVMVRVLRCDMDRRVIELDLLNAKGEAPAKAAKKAAPKKFGKRR